MNPKVATAPRTTLTFHNTHAIISGVRYQHLGRCRYCRKSSHAWSEDGTLRVGLHIRNGGSTCRWYVEPHPTTPTPAPTCPHCNMAGPWWYPVTNTCPLRNHPYYVSALGDAHQREQEVYSLLRIANHDACERADRADQLGHKRFPAPKNP
ncbi:hypothetical protein NE857_09290 [Nocardiopsis exhalans]|uniref:Uncharacterized protein n=1 Tax=Nocardiopsis exhalans TaxID=163604 RepID=A0ABY5DEI2_9ACTN|nr:hypothetical protein [Nocardiopsis exhalans]USY21775.1 hypothetical protein NE857_09290 [Nocardiopsis exhalans]